MGIQAQKLLDKSSWDYLVDGILGAQDRIRQNNLEIERIEKIIQKRRNLLG